MSEILLEQFGQIVRSTEQYPVDFDRAWQWVGYASKQKGLDSLKRNFEEEIDFSTTRLKSTGGRPTDGYFLTVDCFKVFCMMAGTEKGKEVRQYYLRIEKEVLPQIRKTGVYMPKDAWQGLQDLQQRVLKLELNRTVTERLLLRAQRIIERFENRYVLSSEDKREILTLYCRDYPISAIQRITKKGRTRITNFINEIMRGDEDAREALFAEWEQDDEARAAASRDLEGGKA
jgi:phage anti-repressor protein